MDLPPKLVKYTLEHGHADRWVERTAGSGHHRDIAPGEAFALGLLVKLKSQGFQTGKARECVELVEEAVRGIARLLGWAPQFNPFTGDFETTQSWIADIGDRRAFRMLTDANPSGGGRLEEFGWISLGRPRRKLPDFQPEITIRIDLGLIASRFRGKPPAILKARSNR